MPTDIAAQTAPDREIELEINKELVLSTGHMDPALADDIDNGFSRRFMERVEHGYMVYAAPHESPLQVGDYPPDLRPVIRLARIHGCKWVRFDEDGPQVEGLRTWDW